MRNNQSLPRQWGLTGPRPNPLSDLKLVHPWGESVSLHRYAGRWVVLRVTEHPPDATRAVGRLPGADFVALNVVAGPTSPDLAAGPLVFDPERGFAHRFPAIDFPATFVVDPDGRLIAVLDDQGWPGFLGELVRQSAPALARGAIDQQDIRR